MPYKDKKKKKEYDHKRYLKNRNRIIEKQRLRYFENRDEILKKQKEYSKKYNNKPEVKQRKKTWAHKKGINQPMDKNKECSWFLGVYIAENVLSKVFKNVEKMPNGNPGFDFICNKGYKIDVKSSTLRTGIKNLKWCFTLNKNKIPDYFLLLGFDNREKLNPLKLWLIPSNIINSKKSLTITNSKKVLQKWKQYELEEKLEKVILCCNTMKKVEA